MKYLKLFEEIELTIGELEKERGGEERGNILVRKLKERPVKLSIKGNGEKNITKVEVDGKEVTPAVAAKEISTNNKYDKEKAREVFIKNNRYDDVLISGKKHFKLNQVIKTGEFGAVGPGVLTRQYEAIQCLFIAFKLRYPGELVDKDRVIDFWEKYVSKDDEVFKRIGIYLDPKFTLTREMIDSLSTNRDWLNTFIRVPELLMNFKGIFPRVNNPRKYLVFLESNKDVISPVVNIVKKYNELKKIASSNVNFSKFCPADVYIVIERSLTTINKEISAQTSIEGLVKLLDRYFDSNELIPVSLKKLKEGDRVIVNKEKSKKLPDFTIDKFVITDDPLKGIASKLKVKSVWMSETSNGEEEPEQQSRDIIFDSSDTGKARNIDGDILGRSSRHGKVALKSIISFFEKNGFIELYDLTLDLYSKLITKSEDELREMILSTHSDLLELVPDITQVPTRTKIGGVNKMYSDLVEGSTVSNIKNRLISKLQSLQLLVAIATIQSVEPTDANIAITGIMRYALSIQTELFNDTPRYLRII
jgi:hypothetical protein